jgi:hypothetical protein
MTIAINQRNMVVVTAVRNAALKVSAEFNTVRFFSDVDYARASLMRLSMSGVPELAALAAGARDSLFAPVSAVAPAGARAPADEANPAAIAVGPSSPQRYMAAKALMNVMVVDAAGLRSALFVLSLERTSVAADLEALLPRFHKLIARNVGDAAASVLVTQVRNAL